MVTQLLKVDVSRGKGISRFGSMGNSASANRFPGAVPLGGLPERDFLVGEVQNQRKVKSQEELQRFSCSRKFTMLRWTWPGE